MQIPNDVKNWHAEEPLLPLSGSQTVDVLLGWAAIGFFLWLTGAFK